MNTGIETNSSDRPPLSPSITWCCRVAGLQRTEAGKTAWETLSVIQVREDSSSDQGGDKGIHRIDTCLIESDGGVDGTT